jgi:glycogen synthase
MKVLPAVSVVVNTLNRADLLERTLRSFRQLRYRNFEVVVVNGPSLDNTDEVIARYADWIRQGRCLEANLSKSRNIGVAMAKGEIVAFIDDDAVPEPDWLDRLVSGYDEPNVAAVGGFIRDHAGIDYQCKVVVADRFGDAKSFDRLEGELDEERYLSLTGTNSSFRRTLLLQEGGFDEEYAYFLDETDVNVRLVDRGWKARIVADAEVHHKFAASHLRTVDRIPRSMYVTSRSKAYFCCVNAIKTFTLREIVGYLVRFIQSEHRWKRQLYLSGKIERGACDRLIAEVEKGVADGVRDAFAQAQRQLISQAVLDRYAPEQFKRFPLMRAAESRLRICLLSQDYPPLGNGGIGQWTRETAIGLAERGHEVTVVARSSEGHSYVDFCEGVWVHRIHPDPAPPDIVRASYPAPTALVDYSYTAMAEIRRIQPRRGFQVISGPIWDLEPLLSLKVLDIPTVISLHTTYKLALPHKPDWLGNQGYRSAHVDLVVAKERELLATAPFLLSNTYALVRDIGREYGVTIDEDRLRVVPHGLADLSIGVEENSRSGAAFHLLFVGRLEFRKGADLVLKMIPKLFERHPNLIIDIVGDDSIVIDGVTLRNRFVDEHREDRKLLERVRFHGTVSRVDLLRFYKSCDLVISPSRYESFGLVFVEAMMFGKPSVGIAVGGVSEVVTSGRDGILIERDDPVELAEKIASLIQDPEALSRLAREARRTFERKFSVIHMIDALEAYYIDVAASAAGAGMRAEREQANG